MMYIKNFKLFLEELDFKVLPTDTSDIKKSKEYLLSVQNDITEYNQKKSKLDSIFNDMKLDSKGIENKVNSDIFSVEDKRNKYLVHYMTICQDNRTRKNILDKISRERINQSDYRRLLSETEDDDTKKRLNDSIKKSSDEISKLNKEIQEIDKRISVSKKKLNDDMNKDLIKIKKNIEVLDKERN